MTESPSILCAAKILRAADPELRALADDEQTAALLREALPVIRTIAAARRLPRLAEPPTRGPIPEAVAW
jgi:hypothetical protein